MNGVGNSPSVHSFNGSYLPSICDQQGQDKEEKREFWERFRLVSWKRYYYNQPKSRRTCLLVRDSKYYAIMNEDLRPRDLGDIKHYTFAELEEMTGCFNEKNLLSSTRDVKMYNGKIRGVSGDKDVIVKTWVYDVPPPRPSPLFPKRMHDEIEILTHDAIRSSEYFVKLIGFHCDKMLAVVYEGGPKFTLVDVIRSYKFGWSERIEVAIKITELLKEFHKNKGPHGGLFSEYILIDENFSTPKSFHFGVHNYPDGYDKVYDSEMFVRYGYLHWEVLKGPKWLKEYDVFAYGILLLLLISKPDMFPIGSFLDDFKSGVKKTLVHECFNLDDQAFGQDISRLAVQCLDIGVNQCSLDAVLECLQEYRRSKRWKI